MKRRELWIGGAALLALSWALAGCCGECGDGLSDAAKVAKGGYQFFIEMSTAPGTEELKKVGCDTPLVLTPEMLERFLKTVEEVDKNANKQQPPNLPYRMVTCQVAKTKTELDCETIARTYGKAVADAPKEFGVTLQVQGGEEPVCAGVYDPKGERLGELDAAAAESMESMNKQGGAP